jgi:hypothetical protein
MPEAKFYQLVSKHSGCALGPENNNDAPGARLVTVARNEGDQRQFWFTDALSGTIRNMVSGLCISIAGDGNAIMQPYQANLKAQQFALEGNPTIVKNADGRALDITGAKTNVGVPICAYKLHGKANQQWDLAFARPQYFLLRGEKSGRVIDVESSNRAAGAKICLWDANNGDNQQFYEDRNGLVRSKLNDFVFDGSSSDVAMQPWEPNNPNRSWVLSGGAVVLLAKQSMVLEVKGAKDEGGSRFCAFQNKGAAHQRFTMQFV